MAADLVLALALGVLGLPVGLAVDRAAARFPWDEPPVDRRSALRSAVVAATTAALFAFVGLRFGASWELPAFLFGVTAGMLLALIDLRHSLLPDRVVLPSVGIAVVLLAVAALGEDDWPALGRAVLAAGVLFAVFLVMALVSPTGIYMGDVKLSALLGLYLGWLGWSSVLIGAAAGFVVQALIALALLAARRVGLKSEVPFGPAMLIGAALVIFGTS